MLQDRSYKWYVAEDAPTSTSDSDGNGDGVQFANTNLAKLCRYYLACLGHDDSGVSTFLTSKYGDPDYVELYAIPTSPNDLANSDAGRRLLGRKRTERGRYGLYFGYPTSISLLRSRRSNWEGFMVEPVLLFPIEQEEGSGRLVVDLSFPIINQRPFQSFTSADRDMLMNELVQLEQELGLGDDQERPEVDEIAMRLQAVRPEWPWRESIDPESLAKNKEPMAEIGEAGIYNRAIILMAERSPFTRGLEKELRALAQVSEDKLAHTALGRWLAPDGPTPSEPETLGSPLLEVLPMNSEQRQAVSAALTRPVTIITGPPGTGKSQVVTNLLVNAAWAGKRVLFASKNNKAVDVVETRVNALGPRPILLRVGAQAYQTRLAEYVLALISATTSQSEREEFDDARDVYERLLHKHETLTGEAQTLVDLRNDLDHREQAAEAARDELGEHLFSRAVDLDRSALQRAVDILAGAVEDADRKAHPFPVRILWPLFRARRFRALGSLLASSKNAFAEIEMISPDLPAHDGDIRSIKEAVEAAQLKLFALEKAATYKAALRQLQAARPLEDIARQETEVLDRIATHSETLWKLWLRLQPSRLSAEERKKLGKYTSLLKMVIDAGDDGQLSKQAYREYSAMLHQISHLLPCWAVTSLSARGRIPFDPGDFDLVVFDEASQCDIASALPLLYRAKAVAVIGDPQQLSHISGLRRGQDQALLEKFGLMEDYPHWAYSHQSLFALGATQVAGEDVVNLVDHHRSHADIINFANDEFYEERLRVATRYDRLKSPNRKEPGIRWIDVSGRARRPTSGGAINQQEANATVATLRDLVLQKGYEGSIGVVTPFRAQANAVTEAVNRDADLAAALVRCGFLADTVHKFQGDERDVMIFSPVVSAECPPGALGFLKANGNLFNVAITRARAQLIVVGDLAACSASEIGYLSRFATYAASLHGETETEIEIQLTEAGPNYPPVTKPELVSDWEKTFYVAAYKAGFRPIPQYPIEKYVVDFLIVDGTRKLIIEIDGERYHRNWTGELCRRDQIRNQRLFELGYDVLRFWVYEVRDDLPSCLERIEAWQLGKVA